MAFAFRRASSGKGSTSVTLAISSAVARVSAAGAGRGWRWPVVLQNDFHFFGKSAAGRDLEGGGGELR